MSDTIYNYLVIGKEVGESGTPHLQGYIQLKKKSRLAGVKKIIGNRCHIEQCRGTPKENRDYCTKDKQFVEFGQLTPQGRRTDLDELVEDITTNKR